MIQYKKGVPDDTLSFEMEVAKVVCEMYYNRAGYPLVITGTTEDDPKRSKNSYHPTGDAIDIRIRNVKDSPNCLVDSITKRLKALSPLYDVIHYPGSHVHIEFERRKVVET